MDLNMRQVRAFVSVAHLKSFTRAAALLHISQPALTVQLRKLGETLGIRLLDRNSRTVDITRLGRELLPVFQRILRELDSVVMDTRALATQQHGASQRCLRLPPACLRQASPGFDGQIPECRLS
jgi:DNA-binding transcriptional LysR family regulator